MLPNITAYIVKKWYLAVKIDQKRRIRLDLDGFTILLAFVILFYLFYSFHLLAV